MEPEGPETIVTATRASSASAEKIFDLIADPAIQPTWDGNNNLASAAAGQRVHQVGDVFKTTLTNGAVDQSNFHDYRVLRINEAPRIEVHQIRNNEGPGGVGEPGTAAAAPALGNAIFAASGKRLRRLPFGNGQLLGT